MKGHVCEMTPEEGKIVSVCEHIDIEVASNYDV